MQKFIDYFWKNVGFKYNPDQLHFFDWYHFSMMALMVLVFLGLLLIGKKIKNKERLLIVVAVLLFVLESLRVCNFYFAHNYTLFNSFTLHMCSIGVYVGIIAGLIRKNLIFEIMFVPALIGRILAIVIPFGILQWWNIFSFVPIQSYLSHMLMVFMIIYAIKIDVFKVKIKRFYLQIISTTIFAIIIHFINIYKHRVSPSAYSNYFWTRYPDPMFPIINTWVFPYHFILLIILLLLSGFGAYYLVGKLHKEKKIKN